MYKRDKLFVIAILGPAGSGKSTLAETLKNELVDTAHVSSDHIKRYISEFKEKQSHNQVSRNVTDAMTAEYLNNGISTIIDQGMTTEQVEKLKQIAESHNADFFVYKIEAHPDILKARIAERQERINQSMMSQETMDILSKIYEENACPAAATFDSGKLATIEIVDLILKDLKILNQTE